MQLRSVSEDIEIYKKVIGHREPRSDSENASCFKHY
jgi:hypothetical protein